ARRGRSLAIHLEDVSQRAAAMVISQRLALTFGVNKLLAVQRVAMNEIMEPARRAKSDARDAKKIPLNVQRPAVRAEIKPAAQQNGHKSETEANRPVNKGETKDGRQTDDGRVAQVDRPQFSQRDQDSKRSREKSEQDRQRDGERA